MGILRLLLALAVVNGHILPNLDEHNQIGGPAFLSTGGQLAVQAFYVISGFFIALVFTENYSLQPKGNRLFLTNRILRLWPGFLVVTVATIAGHFIAIALGHPIVVRHGGMAVWAKYWSTLTPVSRVMLALPNLFIFGSEWTFFWTLLPEGFVFAPVHPGGTLGAGFLLIPQGWSLGVELSFYLVVPWLLRRHWRWLAAVAAGSLLLRVVTVYGFGIYDGIWAYRVFPQELALFLVGSLSYQCYRWLRTTASPTLMFNCSVAAAIALYGGIFHYSDAARTLGEWRLLGYLVMLPVGLPFLFHLTARNPIDRFIGELSYPVYIVHAGLQPFVRALGWDDPYGFLIHGSSLLAGLLLYLLVDRPVSRWRHTRFRRADRTRVPFPAGALA